MSGGGGGAWGQLIRDSNGHSPGTKYKRSKIALPVISIALSLGRLGTQLMGLPAQSLIGSPSTLASARLDSTDHPITAHYSGVCVPDFLGG